MLLIDTNVVSELRKLGSGNAHPAVAQWARRAPLDQMFLSAVTAMELEIGVMRLERRDAAQARPLRQWLDQMLRPAFAGRILPFGDAEARQCAAFHVPDRRSDRDAMIAATALVRGLAVATRNLRDFEGMGVRLINPWDATA